MKKAVHEGLLFFMLSKGITKTRMVPEPVSIAGLSESGGSAKP